MSARGPGGQAYFRAGSFMPGLAAWRFSMIRQFGNHLVKALARFIRRRGFFLPQLQKIVVILEFILETQKLLVRENYKFLPSVFLDDLWMQCHKNSPISIAPMKYTVHNNPISGHFEQGSPVPHPHPVLGREMGKLFYIAL